MPLTLVCLTLRTLVERANGQRLLAARQQILIDARLLLYVLVRHQRAHMLLKRLRVKVATLMMLVIEQAPRETLHFLTLLREHSLHPLDNRAEVAPQRLRRRIVLMLRHIALDGLALGGSGPRNGRLQELLADARTLQVIVRECRRRTTRLREIALGVGHPRTRIHRVAQLLVGKLLARDVDDAEPIQLLGIRSLADVHEQLVIENLLLPVTRQVVEIPVVHGERPVNVLAQRDGALLAIQNLVPRLVRVVLVLLASVNPVHDVQR